MEEEHEVKMSEIRLAKKGEIARQKEIWKLCFGDSDQYIDFYYTNRYEEDETALFLQGGEILSMLTMLPIKIVTTDQRRLHSTMLYAIATHPKYQHKGFATKLIDFAQEYRRNMGDACAVMVPSGQQLFAFYRHQGYKDGFYIREVSFTRKGLETIARGESCACNIAGIAPQAYNLRRDKVLSGKLYIAYSDRDMAYQVKLSKRSGANIYGLEIEGIQGCAIIERLNSDRVFIKELLMADEFLPMAVKHIAQIFPAQEYILRTPAFLGQQMPGSIRPYGMIRVNPENDFEITPENLGYLGLAFD